MEVTGSLHGADFVQGTVTSGSFMDSLTDAITMLPVIGVGFIVFGLLISLVVAIFAVEAQKQGPRDH